MSYKKSTNLKRGHAKMNRVGEVKAIVDAIGDNNLTKQEIATQSGVAWSNLDQGMLSELCEYGILEKTRGACGYRDMCAAWTTKKPSNIESLKADMMGATV